MNINGFKGSRAGRILAHAHHRVFAGIMSRQVGRFRLDESLLVIGSPRSGTTWLSDALSAGATRCQITEPLDPKYSHAGEYGLGSSRTFRHPDDPWPKGKALFDRIFEGRLWAPESLFGNRLWRIPVIDQLVVKCVRANRLLPWLSHHYPQVRTIYIIRDPFAVVASQLTWPSPPQEVAEDDMALVRNHFSDKEEFVLSLKTPTQFRALQWSLDQLVPFMFGPLSASVVRYEALVREGEELAGRIAAKIDWPWTKASSAMLQRNSRERRTDSPDHTHDSVTERLNHWKKRLSPDQAAQIRHVVGTMGVMRYVEELPEDMAM